MLSRHDGPVTPCNSGRGRLNTQAPMQQQDPELLPQNVQQLLNCGETQRYAFHWYEGVFPPNLQVLLYRQHQQDTLRHGWDGLVAGTDERADERTERMGSRIRSGIQSCTNLDRLCLSRRSSRHDSSGTCCGSCEPA
jgi:hypothetical protein